MPTEDIEKQQKDLDERAETEKELSEEELNQASGGSLNFTSPTPTINPGTTGEISMRKAGGE